MLHVLRFKREALPALIDALNATGYGLTGGVHSRIDTTIDFVAERLAAGNLYVNRNIIGAVGRRAAVRRPWPVGHRSEGGRAALSQAAARRARPPPGRRCRPASRTQRPRRSRPSSPKRDAGAGERCAKQIVAREPARRRASSCPVRSARRTSIRSSRAAPCCATPRTKPTMIVQTACALATGNRALLAARRPAELVAAPARAAARPHRALRRGRSRRRRADRPRRRGADRLRRRDRAPRRADRLGLPRLGRSACGAASRRRSTSCSTSARCASTPPRRAATRA